MPDDIPAPASKHHIPKIPVLSSIQDFLFGASLYAEYNVGKNVAPEVAFNMFVQPLVVDGHCPDCQKMATFCRTRGDIPILALNERLESTPAHFFQISCARNEKHYVFFLLQLKKGIIQKVGQYPSLADIANDESRLYRQVLKSNDGADLHRAIGLAAHGIGVGSFVYLRRVFERLITHRFNDLKGDKGWNDLDFVGKRMEDKLELLKDDLPEFLVRNKRVYAILSQGIHDLEEPECLSAFEMLKHSIFFILDEDKHQQEQLELRRKAEKAIANFSTKKLPG
jgi:hypothetical protein